MGETVSEDDDSYSKARTRAVESDGQCPNDNDNRVYRVMRYVDIRIPRLRWEQFLDWG